MKLVRFGPRGQERPGALDAAGRVRDVSGHVGDWAGAALTPQRLAPLRALDLESLPLAPEGARLGACVGGVGKFMGIGLNYRDHAAESGMSAPAEPLLFLKASSAVAGPYDDVPIPRGAEKVDWEVELGVVIGAPAKYVPVERAFAHVAGYCVVNDISERAFQLEGSGQWSKGKSCDGFGPIGPWLVTADEIADPQNLRLWLEVDGRRHQDSVTAEMIFPIAYLISYLSGFFTLQPGDVIATGTPKGVGLGQKPPLFLRAGQVMRLGVEGLGEQRQKLVAEA